jgi:hypothetical protein
MFICSSSFFVHGTPSGLPMALLNHSLSSSGAQQEHLQAELKNAFSRQECQQAEEFTGIIW